MAASDYVMVAGWQNCYLARKKKESKKSPKTMSQDRRVIEESEMIGLFEFYLRRYCENNNTDTVVINNGKKNIFEAKLLDKEEN